LVPISDGNEEEFDHGVASFHCVRFCDDWLLCLDLNVDRVFQFLD